jgi:hypothetical protein
VTVHRTLVGLLRVVDDLVVDESLTEFGPNAWDLEQACRDAVRQAYRLARRMLERERRAANGGFLTGPSTAAPAAAPEEPPAGR